MIKYDCSIISNAVIKMLKVNMGLEDGERVLFLGDIPRPGEWRLSYNVISDMALRSLMLRQAHEIARDAFPDNRIDLLFYRSTGMHGAEPPISVARKLPDYQVIIIINSFSISHTRARADACAKGTRIASCANLDLEMLYPGGVVDTDYYFIKEKSDRIAALLTQARKARLITDEGTDLSFSLADRTGYADSGFYTAPGAWGNLPAGEAYIAPVEGSGQGSICIPAGWDHDLHEDMVFKVEDGALQSIVGGGDQGKQYRSHFLQSDSPGHRRNLAELGIGTNDKAKRPDNVLEAEKIDGTVHIAFGDNSHFGGIVESDSHHDFVIPKPDLFLDDKLVMKSGKLLV